MDNFLVKKIVNIENIKDCNLCGCVFNEGLFTNTSFIFA